MKSQFLPLFTPAPPPPTWSKESRGHQKLKIMSELLQLSGGSCAPASCNIEDPPTPALPCFTPQFTPFIVKVVQGQSRRLAIYQTPCIFIQRVDRTSLYFNSSFLCIFMSGQCILNLDMGKYRVYHSQRFCIVI